MSLCSSATVKASSGLCCWCSCEKHERRAGIPWSRPASWVGCPCQTQGCPDRLQSKAAVCPHSIQGPYPISQDCRSQSQVVGVPHGSKAVLSSVSNSFSLYSSQLIFYLSPHLKAATLAASTGPTNPHSSVLPCLFSFLSLFLLPRFVRKKINTKTAFYRLSFRSTVLLSLFFG